MARERRLILRNVRERAMKLALAPRTIVHRRDPSHAGPRHRGEHGHFQRRQRRAARSTPGRGSRSFGLHPTSCRRRVFTSRRRSRTTTTGKTSPAHSKRSAPTGEPPRFSPAWTGRRWSKQGRCSEIFLRFSASTPPSAEPSALGNPSREARYWPGEDPIGRQVTMEWGADDQPGPYGG